jgi:Ala-tRNA(Pro) deacylase
MSQAPENKAFCSLHSVEYCDFWPLAVREGRDFQAIGKPSMSEMQPKTPDELFEFLDSLGIAHKTMRHEPVFTVADSQALRGEIAGGHTKNLFLKDKKDNFFLVTVGEDAVVDLKQSTQVIGAASRVSFGKPEMLMELLGVTPGAVTVFGVINDTANRVKLVLDKRFDGACGDQLGIR